MRAVSFNVDFKMPTYDGGVCPIIKNEYYIFTESFIREIRAIYGDGLINSDVDYMNFHKPYSGQDLNGKTIFCFRTSGIGDLLAMSVALRLIKEKYPDVKIKVGSSLGYKDLFTNMDFVDEFVAIPYPMKYINGSDYAFYFQGIVESGVEAQSINMYDLFIKYMGIDFGDQYDINPKIIIDKKVKKIVNTLFKANGAFDADKKIVGVQLGTSSILRNYPRTYYKELVSRLHACGLFVVLLGDIGYDNFVNELGLDNNNMAYNFAKTSNSLQHFFSSIDLCDFIISPDTSALHIAGALNKPMIGLFGPIRSDLRIKHFNNAIGIDCKMICSPCFKHGNKPCRNSDQNGNSFCMHLIDPEKIIDVVKNKMLPMLGDTTQMVKPKNQWRVVSDGPRAIVTLAIGDKAMAEHMVALNSIEAYAKKVNASLVVIKNKKIHYRNEKFEKFQIKDLFSKYDRIMYVDADILIHPDCPDLFNIVPDDCIGAVPDCNDGKWGNLNRFDEIRSSQEGLGDIGWTSGYFNSGMIIMSNIHQGLFDNPENREKINSQFGDQTILNYNMFENKYKFHPLEPIFNGMEMTGYSSRTEPQNKTRAMIMHFANEGNKEEQMKKTSYLFSEFKKKLLFYDCGELGWSMYLVAHLKYLSEINKNEITVVTYKSRFPLYNGMPLNMIEIPNDLYEEIKHLRGDGNHLYDTVTNTRIKHDILSEIFKKYFPDYNIVPEYDKFIGKRKFEKYQTSDNAIKEMNNIIGNKDVILVFPRKRDSKFAMRNLPNSFYIELCNRLCTTYFNHKIISIGSNTGAYSLEEYIKHENFIDLTEWDNDQTIDLLIAMCISGKAKLAIGSQSSLPKISLLCGTPTFMIGHEKERHMIQENWLNNKAGFFDLSDNGGSYEYFDYDKCIEEFMAFSDIQIPINVRSLDEVKGISEESFNDFDFDSRSGSEYINNIPLVFYDIGEIGWSPYISAYIRMFKNIDEKNNWRRIIVITSKAKHVFYRDCCDDIVDIPEKFKTLVIEKGYEPERNRFVDPNSINPDKEFKVVNNNQIKNIFQELLPDCEIFNKYDKISTVNNKYFAPYISSKSARDKVREICGDKKAILVFPRRREGRFGNRNLSLDFYRDLVLELSNQFKDHMIVSVGTMHGSYVLSEIMGLDKLVDLTMHDSDETLDILVAFGNLEKASFAVGSQSGLPKISLLCEIPTFMIGHEKERHMVKDNWIGTKCGFYELNVTSNDRYELNEEESIGCINSIMAFGTEIIK